MIYTNNRYKVMLDSDLAKLYGVETKVLNQAVKRNLKRFPEDFMLACNLRVLDSLEKNTHKLFKIIFERLDKVEDHVTAQMPPNRKKIGLK